MNICYQRRLLLLIRIKLALSGMQGTIFRYLLVKYGIMVWIAAVRLPLRWRVEIVIHSGRCAN